MIELTFVNSLVTVELSPPLSASPQVTTEPSSFRAAKAPSALTIELTPLVKLLATAELSPP